MSPPWLPCKRGVAVGDKVGPAAHKFRRRKRMRFSLKTPYRPDRETG